jgi:predicted CXXCH cytochrome family protein
LQDKFARKHAPFAKGQCNACHDPHAANDYRLIKKSDPELCLGCHKHDDVLDSFNHTGNHMLGAGKENPCTRCHTPHAADSAGLLPGSAGSVCRDCHADTFERRQDMLHKHPDWENCTNCHALHGSDYPTMLKDEPDKVCAECHGRHTTFVHPIGEKAIDPRNGRPMTCITCHDPNTGTMFQYNLRGSGERGLCVECHRGY